MESSKESFSNVLKRAQKLGYAEPGNPKLDLNGYDAFAKIRILSSLSFNKKISNKYVTIFFGYLNNKSKNNFNISCF